MTNATSDSGGRPRIGLMLGDTTGIGPELIVKLIASHAAIGLGAVSYTHLSRRLC